jgi:hypothetical protein
MYFDFDNKTNEISWNALNTSEAYFLLEALELALQKYDATQKRMMQNNNNSKELIKVSNQKHFYQVNISLLQKLFKNETKNNSVHKR